MDERVMRAVAQTKQIYQADMVIVRQGKSFKVLKNRFGTTHRLLPQQLFERIYEDPCGENKSITIKLVVMDKRRYQMRRKLMR